MRIDAIALRCGLSLALLFTTSLATAANKSSVAWLRSEPSAFAQAAKEKRFVLLYLEAVWCHWCHVMDETTYANAEVAAAIEKNYVPLRIDQDARPDLANRYRDYGWPATIVFGPDGREIVKRQGYIRPENMLRLLAAIVADPTPEALAKQAPDSASPSAGLLSPRLREQLLQRHANSFDAVRGGLKTGQKYLERDSVEYSLARALGGDSEQAAQARKTLDAALALMDPAWGGVYQYSTGGDWQHPHFEKLTSLQAQYLRIYALAYAAFKEPRYLDAAITIRGYMQHFLRDPNGGYAVSQDADLRPGQHSAEYFALGDQQRRELGIPRIDRSAYALQNGEVAEALATLAEYLGDPAAQREAERLAHWALAQRALSGGGFRHAEKDSAGPYLGDTLAMGRAFLALYRSSGDSQWLDHAAQAASFIERNFRQAQGGYLSAVSSGPIAAIAQIDENINLARFLNLLSHYTGKAEHRAGAEHCMAYLGRSEIALSRLTEAGVLLADDEMRANPIHLTVVGGKQDALAAPLFAATQRLPNWYKRIEWWDRSLGALPNPDVNYPALKRPAAFVCTERRCSVPLFKAADIEAFLAESEK